MGRRRGREGGDPEEGQACGGTVQEAASHPNSGKGENSMEY